MYEIREKRKALGISLPHIQPLGEIPENGEMKWEVWQHGQFTTYGKTWQEAWSEAQQKGFV
jgi:hypothetical protein